MPSSKGPGPAEREMREQSVAQRKIGEPILTQVGELINRALAGDMGFFEQSPLAQRRASLTREAGGRQRETARRRQAQLGIEGSGVGEAQLMDIEAQTEGGVIDAILSEVTKYLDLAPAFGIDVMRGAGGAQGVAVNAEAQRRNQQGVFDSILRATGIAAGLAIGGPLGAAVGDIAGGIFSTKPTGTVGSVNSTTSLSSVPGQDLAIGGGFVT